MVIEKVVWFVPGSKAKWKALKDTIASSGAGPPVSEVGTMSSIEKEGDGEGPDVVITFAFAGAAARIPPNPVAIAKLASLTQGVLMVLAPCLEIVSRNEDACSVPSM